MKTLVKSDLIEIKTLDRGDLAQIEVTTRRMVVEIFVDAGKSTKETERNHCDRVLVQNRLPHLLSGESLGKSFRINAVDGYATVNIRAIDIKKGKGNWTCARCDAINQFDVGYCIQCRGRRKKNWLSK